MKWFRWFGRRFAKSPISTGILRTESWKAGKLEGMDAVIHLAGESIAGLRWTREKKKRILKSRVQGTRFLCQALAAMARPPKVLLSASAIGYYGDRPVTEEVDENSPKGKGFLAEVAEAWEMATEDARASGIRVVNMRFGMVLSNQGGAFPKMLYPFKWGLGGKLGSGRQPISWVLLGEIRMWCHTSWRRKSVRALSMW